MILLAYSAFCLDKVKASKYSTSSYEGRLVEKDSKVVVGSRSSGDAVFAHSALPVPAGYKGRTPLVKVRCRGRKRLNVETEGTLEKFQRTVGERGKWERGTIAQP